MVENSKHLKWGSFLFWAILLVVVVISFSPLLWLLITSLKTEAELFKFPITYIPKEVTLQNYIAVFTRNPFGRFLLNSIVTTFSSTCFIVVISSMAAYALSRLNMPFKRLIMGCILVFSMLPIISLVLSIFLITRNLGILNTYQGLIGPYITFQLPLAIYVLNNFFSQIPTELEESAKIDGATPLQTMNRIIMPLSLPGIMSASILVSIMNWNDFVIAATLTTSQEMRTIPVGIVLYPGEFAFPWGTISAASILAVIPIAFFILFAQKWIITGLTAGSLKG